MKKMIVLLLVLAMCLVSLAAPAEGNDGITLEVNTAKLAIYEPGDPYLAGLIAETDPAENPLPVLMIAVKKGCQIQVNVQPRNVKNKQVTLTVADEDVAQVRGNTLTGLKPGETVLTIASVQDPSVQIQYRVLVIQHMNRISVTAAEKTVAVGGTVALTPAILPEDATIQRIVWSSADERIATVDENGIVTGVKRGTARLVASAADGSNLRANISLPVVQNAEEIQIENAEITLDVGRNAAIKATVLPKDTNDKAVVWSTSDESIATVNAQGRVTGVALGDCEITCASKTSGDVFAKAVIHVQQPVTSITFDEAPAVYVNETGKLTWHVEPANASNPAVALSSGNEKILTVSEDGTVTGLKAGETFVRAVSTDGSNRQTRVKVKVFQHVESVHMKRHTAYIDKGTTSIAGAILTPKNAANQNMTWVSDNPSIASVKPVAKQTYRVNITGNKAGTTTVTGTTVDGGLQTSIKVVVGNFEKSIQLEKDHTFVQGNGDVVIRVKNVGTLTITSVTATVSVTDVDGKPVPCNSKDGSNTFKVVYNGTLEPGQTSRDSRWKYVDFKRPNSPAVSQYEVRITEFQIDNDWVKTIHKKNQPVKKCPVHL